MKKPLIAGNWKMNGTKASIDSLLQALIQHADLPVEYAVFPPYVYLEQVRQILAGSQIVWGAQDIFSQDAGAFTGKISGAMLKEFQCRYVIIGHSERRTLFGETNQVVAEKFIAAQRHQLIPILCVGETLEERKQGKTTQVIDQQLATVLNLVDNLEALSQAVIAYEPVWAIGTGHNATSAQISEVHAGIRNQLDQTHANLGKKIRILYGGSVKPDNAAAIFNEKEVDGALVGGASLNADQFLKIAAAFPKR